MSLTTIPTLIIEDIELRIQPSLRFRGHPISCHHLWELDPSEADCAHCVRCGSRAHWIDTREG